VVASPAPWLGAWKHAGVDWFVVQRPHRASWLADAVPTAEVIEASDALDGHRLAWEELDTISCIGDASCLPLAPELLGDGLAALLGDEDVVVLGGTDQSWCYLLTPDGAERLAARPGGLADRLAGCASVDPPLVHAAGDPLPLSDELAPPSGQLDVLLGYRDAVDLTPGWWHLDADVLVVPCWTPAFCRALVDAAAACDAWSADPDDPVPGNELSLATISPLLHAHVQAHWAARIWPVISQVWPMIDFVGLRDAFVIRYAPDTVPDLRMHHDVGQVSASIKLDDDYTGGQLAFPRQQVTNANVPVGSAVIWPSLVTHVHRSQPVTSGVKHAVTVWCEIPDVDRNRA
jgi:hypothetical protein